MDLRCAEKGALFLMILWTLSSLESLRRRGDARRKRRWGGSELLSFASKARVYLNPFFYSLTVLLSTCSSGRCYTL